MATLNLACVGIKEHAATGFVETSGVFHFTVPDLPSDGSVALAYITVPSSLGAWKDDGGNALNVDRRLIAFLGSSYRGANFLPAAGGYPVISVRPPVGWHFVQI